MATHHQKIHPLDQPATKRDVLRMMAGMARATDARLTAAGIPPLPVDFGVSPPTGEAPEGALYAEVSA